MLDTYLFIYYYYYYFKLSLFQSAMKTDGLKTRESSWSAVGMPRHRQAAEGQPGHVGTTTVCSPLPSTTRAPLCRRCLCVLGPGRELGFTNK